MGLAWTDQLSVGNALIDSDHKNLMIVVDRIQAAIQNQDRICLSMSFELLDSYMQIHLQNEERIAEAINYPFAQDKFAHVQLMDELRYMITKLEAMPDTWPDNLLQMYSRFLSNWMTEHIVKINMNMKSALQAYPHNFIPGNNPNACLFQTTMVLPIRTYTEPSPPIW